MPGGLHCGPLENRRAGDWTTLSGVPAGGGCPGLAGALGEERGEWLFCRRFQLKVFVKHSVLAPGGGGGWFSQGELAYVQPYKTGKAEPTGERANSKMWSSAPRPTFGCVRAVE